VLGGLHHFLLDTFPGTPVLCYYNVEPTVAAILWHLDTVMYSYAPCAMIFLANILILIAIFKSRGTRGGLGRLTHKTSNEGRLLVSLMLVSTLFIVLVMPMNTSFTYLAEEKENMTLDEAIFVYLIVKILTVVCVLNYCINFIVYGCTLPYYRREALLLLTYPTFILKRCFLPHS
jgi:hypothetical protein